MNTNQLLTLLEALDVAIEYIEAITGDNDSPTLDHLRSVYEEAASWE